jgi:dTDP-4-amino-4,6-dideoxygalactose transaminase
MGGEEPKFIREAFKSNYIAPLGPMVDAFEREFADYVGIGHCVAVSSGTAAMHLALRVLGVGKGGEVAASTMTFIGSITPIIFQGATPVFIDSERETWNMDPELLAEALEESVQRNRVPQAVIPTDLYGQCVDYDRIYSICRSYQIPVVVDAAEALGARYHSSKLKAQSSKTIASEGMKAKAKGGKASSRPIEDLGSRIEHQASGIEDQKLWLHAGVGASAVIFSFNGNKILNTSGGGMLVSDSRDFIEQARFLSQQARDPFSHYEHSTIGYNYRMSNILAAIGRGQLRVLDERVEKKRWIFDYYRKTLKGVPGIEFMPAPEWSRSSRWLTVVLITPEEFGTDRETVRLALESENIESRPVWKPMHLQPVFRIKDQSLKLKAQIKSKATYKAKVMGGDVAEDLFNRGLCLPSGTQLTEEDLDRIIRIIRKQHR